MILGVTGTRAGMTPAQRAAVLVLLNNLSPRELHHGACAGVDAEIAAFAKELLGDACWVVARPGLYAHGRENPASSPTTWESRAALDISDEVQPPMTHFARNRRIVAFCDLLLVVPKEATRQESGGTWYTYDHAVKVGRPRVVVWPNGDWREEG